MNGCRAENVGGRSSLLFDIKRCSVLTPSFRGPAEFCRHHSGAATPIDLKFASQWVCQHFSGLSTSFVTWQQSVDMQVPSFVDLQSPFNLWSRREKLPMRAAFIQGVWSRFERTMLWYQSQGTEGVSLGCHGVRRMMYPSHRDLTTLLTLLNCRDKLQSQVDPMK